MQKSNWKGLSLTQDGASQRRGVVSFSGFSDLASPNRSGRDKINQYPFGIYRQHISENARMLRIPVTLGNPAAWLNVVNGPGRSHLISAFLR
jgi:hypothetical protein